VRSEGLEEKYQAVIKGATPMMNRSAKDGARSSPHYGGEGVLVHPSYQGVCGRHGTEDCHVTHGGLVSSGGGTVNGPVGKYSRDGSCRAWPSCSDKLGKPVKNSIR